jgi:hypothetical protein
VAGLTAPVTEIKAIACLKRKKERHYINTTSEKDAFHSSRLKPLHHFYISAFL